MKREERGIILAVAASIIILSCGIFCLYTSFVPLPTTNYTNLTNIKIIGDDMFKILGIFLCIASILMIIAVYYKYKEDEE